MKWYVDESYLEIISSANSKVSLTRKYHIKYKLDQLKVEKVVQILISLYKLYTTILPREWYKKYQFLIMSQHKNYHTD